MKQIENIEDEDSPSEVPLSLVPYPYNRVPDTFGKDKPQYPELRKLLIQTLDRLIQEYGILSPSISDGKLEAFYALIIEPEPFNYVEGMQTLHVSAWQGAREIMNFLTNEHLIEWDRDTEVYRLVKRVRESIEEEDPQKTVSAFEKPLKSYDLYTLYKEYDNMAGERLATIRFMKIVHKYNCTPQEIAEAINLYEPRISIDWLTYIAREVEKAVEKKVKIVETVEEEVEEREDEEDMVSFSKPGRALLPEEIAKSPTYFDAWVIFSSRFRELEEINREIETDETEYAPIIPTQHGQFERWWLGLDAIKGLDEQSPNEWPSPFGQITIQDIEKLAETDLDEVHSLFSNIFYNHTLNELDPAVMEAICRILLADDKERKPTIRRMLDLPNDIHDLLESPFADSLDANLRDLLLTQSSTPEAIKNRNLINIIAENPKKQDELIKKAVKERKSQRRR